MSGWMTEFRGSLTFVLLAVPVAVFVVVGLRLMFAGWPRNGLRTLLVDAAIAASVVLILAFTVISTGIVRDTSLSLVPFSGGSGWRELAANVLLFAPLGFSLRRHGRTYAAILMIVGTFAVCIEAAQVIGDLGRSATTTDVVAALVGGALGAAIASALEKAFLAMSRSAQGPVDSDRESIVSTG